MTFYTKDKLLFLFEVAKYVTFSMCDPTYKVPNANSMNNPPAVISTRSTTQNNWERINETNISTKRLTTSIVDSNRRLEDRGVKYESDVDNIGSSFGTLHLNHLKFKKVDQNKMRDTSDTESSSDSSYSENKYRLATRKIIERNKRAKRKVWMMEDDKYNQSVYVNTNPHLETLRQVINEYKD